MEGTSEQLDGVKAMFFYFLVTGNFRSLVDGMMISSAPREKENPIKAPNTL